jgi:hypothetical protein
MRSLSMPLAWAGAEPLTLAFQLNAEMPSLSLNGRGETQRFTMRSAHGSGWVFGISAENGRLRRVTRARRIAGMMELPYRSGGDEPIYTLMKANGDLAGL